jgi:glycosyltransferase involved in cell wall biosynthesis
MNIGLLAPFEESVPPEKYGGTELVVANLAQGLVNEGHTVFVLATGDSKVAGTLISIFPRAIRKESFAASGEVRNAMKIDGVARVLANLSKLKLDIIHNHIGWRFIPFAQQLSVPVVTTLHKPPGIDYEKLMYTTYPQHPYISISNSQRQSLPELNYIATVYNGIDVDHFTFKNEPGSYLAFLGRMSPEKGPKQAIEVAKEFNMPLKMAAKVDTVDKEYFTKEIEPLIDDQQIQFVGEIGPEQKSDFLSNAYALLAPIQWEEPFGLFMVEAMACGTPVVALKRGSVPEIIVHGRTGFIASNTQEMAEYLKQIPSINRSACREHIEKNFSIKTMTAAYLDVYKQQMR